MDPLDRPDDVIDGAACAACGQPVAESAIRTLAEREDLAFVQLGCGRCGSLSLAMVIRPAGVRPDAVGDPKSRPIGTDDVLAMRAFLAAWRGDLRQLLLRDGRRSKDGSAGAA